MRLAAVLLLFKEEAFIEATFRSIYPVVDSICAVTQYDRTFKGEATEPSGAVARLLSLPDPENKLRLTILRDPSSLPGNNSEARLRNAAMRADPDADYYLIVDADEIWPLRDLQECWAEVQRSQWAAYRISSSIYFRKWNYRIVGDAYRPLVFLRRGFSFLYERQVNWRGPARWREYLRKGRKPKTVYFPEHLMIHHGSCIGDDSRILTKILNWGHSEDVDPAWFDRVWKNFHPGMTDLHYYKGGGSMYERITEVPTADLPAEIRNFNWPSGWID